MCGRTRKVRGSKPFAEGLAEAHERARKSLRSLRSPFAEADPIIQPKNLQPRKAEAKKTTSKRYSRKDRGRASRKG